MRIAWNNFLDEATLVPSSTGINRKVSDIKIPHLTRSFSFGTDTGNIVIDFGESKEVNCFILGGTNLEASDTVTLEANNSNEWTSPSFSQSINMYSKNQLLFLNETYQYWRVVISSTNDDISIGHIFIGQYLQMPPIKADMNHEHNRTDKLTLSVGLNAYGDIGYDFYSAKFTFPIIKGDGDIINGIQIASRSEILKMWNAVGSITPIYMIIWESDLDSQPPIFGILNQTSIVMAREDKYKSYKAEINFQETR